MPRSELLVNGFLASAIGVAAMAVRTEVSQATRRFALTARTTSGGVPARHAGIQQGLDHESLEQEAGSPGT